MVLTKMPIVRVNERTFVLCYVLKDGITPIDKIKVIGYKVLIHFGTKYRKEYILSACDTNWHSIDNNYFNSAKELFLVSEVFYGIKPKLWKGCHPPKNMPLYSKPRTKIERLHKVVLSEINFLKKHSQKRDFRSMAYYAGARYDIGMEKLDKKVVSIFKDEVE